jgi:nicotinate-nucleotide pyrophosphorylase (carboxylating)
MLDNFDGAGIHIAALALKEEYKDRAQAGSFLIEGSGGLTESNIAAYFSPAVDILSCGSLSQSVPHIDFSLKL